MVRTSSISARSIPALIENRRVIVCLGPGGVGKTTLSAAIAIQAAVLGRRVHCLTIDPARRLATAIGMDRWPESETVDLTENAALEIALARGGRLTFSILDPARIFDRMLEQGLANRPRSQRLLKTPMIRDLVLNLAGMTDILAIERLANLRDDPDLDLVVLDTSPAAQTLEFLGLPGRIKAFLSGSSGKLISLGAHSLEADSVASRTLNRTIKGLRTLAGQEGFGNVMRLIAEGSDLIRHLEHRAGRMAREGKGRDVAMFLITSPEPMRAREASGMVKHLAEIGIVPSALIFNRVHPPPCAGKPSIDRIKECLAAVGGSGHQAESIAKKLLNLRSDRERRVASEQGAIDRLLAMPEVSSLPAAFVPVMEIEPGSFRSLKAMADHLASPRSVPMLDLDLTPTQVGEEA